MALRVARGLVHGYARRDRFRPWFGRCGPATRSSGTRFGHRDAGAVAWGAQRARFARTTRY
jgi:hypothetical protein